MRNAALTTLAVCLAFGLGSQLLGDAYQDRRVETGLKIFRALLAADLDLERKTVDDGKLLVVFFYTDDSKRAAELGSAFAKGSGSAAGEPIRGKPVEVETVSDAAMTRYAQRVPAGIFLSQAPDAGTLRAIINLGIANHVIVYSPFEGHVESGVLGGLAVEAQVRPYINGATLHASSISLKEFFLKVAKVYR